MSSSFLLFRNNWKAVKILVFSQHPSIPAPVLAIRQYWPTDSAHLIKPFPMPTSRPKHLNLMEIRLPLPAFVSILHRVSGAILFLLLPLLLCLLGSSLESQQSFSQFKAWVGNPLLKIVLLGVLWAYLHHFCAGIRHLAMDMHLGLELQTARATSYAVLAVSLTLTAVIGGLLW